MRKNDDNDAISYLLSGGICLVSANNCSPGKTLYHYVVLAGLALAGVGLGTAAVVEGGLAFQKLNPRQKRIVGLCVAFISVSMAFAPLALVLLAITVWD